MRLILLLGLFTSCVPRVHADTYVKKNFGFAGPREITLVGPSSDTNALRLLLQRHGFSVLEVDRVAEATTRYVADIAGVCNWRMVSWSSYTPDVELHVFVLKTDTRERVFSARLDDNSDCPEAFFAEAAAGIARNWSTPIEASR